MDAQLWYVEHNGGLAGGRKDRVWRFAALARTAEEAVALTKEHERDAAGEWSAELYGGAVASLGLVFSRPPEEDRPHGARLVSIGDDITKAWHQAENQAERQGLLSEITLALSGLQGADTSDRCGYREHVRVLVMTLRAQLDYQTLTGGAPLGAHLPGRATAGEMHDIAKTASNLVGVLTLWHADLMNRLAELEKERR